MSRAFQWWHSRCRNLGGKPCTYGLYRSRPSEKLVNLTAQAQSEPRNRAPHQEIGPPCPVKGWQSLTQLLNLHITARTVLNGPAVIPPPLDTWASGMSPFSISMFSLFGVVTFCEMGVGRKQGAEGLPHVHAVTPIAILCPADTHTGSWRHLKSPSSTRFGQNFKNWEAKNPEVSIWFPSAVFIRSSPDLGT